ncbi:MAG: hypothetical protein OEU32_19100, partial [Acidimicrobiia bacterium]|nr:hypothetical protein [Acidimicrobiia bacterium]
NGVVFARSNDGLRGRPPWSVEWKGPHRPPGYEQIPADLRVDHVYLISCKYGSTILHNVSPAHLFDRLLAERRIERGGDWFGDVAPEAYQDLYDAYRRELGLDGLPDRVGDLERGHRAALKAAAPADRRWPGAAADVYRDLIVAVAQASAERWRGRLTTRASREEMLWRILRFQAAPYFVLGSSTTGHPTRYRVATPSDFRHAFDLRSIDVWPDPAGQPLVRWRADAVGRMTGDRKVIEGHVEVRWSHGRFSGAPEAKVHLDTPPHDVAGYFPLR